MAKQNNSKSEKPLFNNQSFINKTILGILFYCIGMFLTTGISVFVKKTMQDYKLPSWEVVFIREIFVLIILFPFMVKWNVFCINYFVLSSNVKIAGKYLY